MRILMLAQFYAPDIGGEERHVQDLSRELVQRGHEVSVVTFQQPGVTDFEVDQGVHVHRIRSTTGRAAWLYSESQRRHAPPFPDPEATWAIQQLINHEKPDIVHAHNWLVHSYLPLKLWNEVPLILSLHDYSLRCAQKRLMYRSAICEGPLLSKCLVCASDYYGGVKGKFTALSTWVMVGAKHVAVNMFLPVSRATAEGNGLVAQGLPFQVIPNFVSDRATLPDQAIDPYLAKLPQGDFLLFVGDLSHDKGIDVLLQAYAGLSHMPPLVLIGRKRSHTPLPDVPPHVMILGAWPHEAVMQAWQRSLFGLVPSVWLEPFGIVAIEAMSAGKPVIASDIGGLQDIVVHGETGLLVPPGKVEALQEAIRRLVTQPALCEQMGRAAQQRAALYRAEVVVPRVEQIYREVVERRKRQVVHDPAGISAPDER